MIESCLIFCSSDGPLCVMDPCLVFHGYDRSWFLHNARNIVSTKSHQGGLLNEYYTSLSYDTVLCSLCTLLDSYKGNIQNFSLNDAVVWGTRVKTGTQRQG
jgi:hypothetical protein